MSNGGFGHDPSDANRIDPSAPTSFEEAKEALGKEEVGGIGFVMTRHDPFLVVEILDGSGDVPSDTVLALLNGLGLTFAEKDEGPDGTPLIRAIYKGELPGTLHGGDPVVFTIGGEDVSYAVRIYDRGWVAMTGNHVPGTGKETEPIDEGTLRRVLKTAGKLPEDEE